MILRCLGRGLFVFVNKSFIFREFNVRGFLVVGGGFVGFIFKESLDI